MYSAIIANFDAFKHPKLENKDYFVAALKNEQDHRQFLAERAREQDADRTDVQDPRQRHQDRSVAAEHRRRAGDGVRRGLPRRIETFSSLDLKVVAAKVAACEATHFSFFDAAAGAGPAANLGGHGVLPSLPGTATIPATVNKLKPFLG